METLFYLADQNPHRDRSRGITEYSSGLINGLAATGELKVRVVTSQSSYQGEGSESAIKLPFRTDWLGGRLVADVLSQIWISSPDILHYPKGFMPGLKPRAQLICGTVHDMILQYYMDHYPAARSKLAYAYWLQVLKCSFSRFDLILTVSHFSARAIRKFCARHGIHCPPIRVTHNGCRWSSETATGLEKENYLIHLGSREPHKRTASLIDYWLSRKDRSLKLRIVGFLPEETQAKAASCESIELLPTMDEAHLKHIMGKARALLLPSEVEGFGLPALEAYAVGTPVVYVKGTAVEEILGANTPGGFELDDSYSLDLAIEETVNLPAWVVAERARDLLQTYSWKECARRTLAAYREFLLA